MVCWLVLVHCGESGQKSTYLLDFKPCKKQEIFAGHGSDLWPALVTLGTHHNLLKIGVGSYKLGLE
jgi:hypothetical protein